MYLEGTNLVNRDTTLSQTQFLLQHGKVVFAIPYTIGLLIAVGREPHHCRINPTNNSRTLRVYTCVCVCVCVYVCVLGRGAYRYICIITMPIYVHTHKLY